MRTTDPQRIKSIEVQDELKAVLVGWQDRDDVNVPYSLIQDAAESIGRLNKIIAGYQAANRRLSLKNRWEKSAHPVTSIKINKDI